MVHCFRKRQERKEDECFEADIQKIDFHSSSCRDTYHIIGVWGTDTDMESVVCVFDTKANAGGGTIK